MIRLRIGAWRSAGKACRRGHRRNTVAGSSPARHCRQRNPACRRRLRASARVFRRMHATRRAQRFLWLQLAHRRGRVDAGAEQARRVDADAHHHAAVHDEELHWCAPAAAGLVQYAAASSSGSMPRLARSGWAPARPPQHQAKAPRIAQAQGAGPRRCPGGRASGGRSAGTMRRPPDIPRCNHQAAGGKTQQQILLRAAPR